MIAEDQFKSYDDLKKKFERIIGESADASSTIEDDLDTEEGPSLESVDEDTESSEDFDDMDVDIDDDDLEDFKSLVGD